MGDAVWHFFQLPLWYISTILDPFAVGWLTAIPAIGMLCLAAGVTWGLVKEEPSLLVFLLLPAVSQLLVVVAGFLPRSLQGSAGDPILWAFLLLEVAVAGFLVWRLKWARGPAAALAAFALSYAFFACFVAGMDFSGH
jgi:hypothetical protein